uniref:Uncharacterized protein n=1 Tax=Compsopogon caeruleus TaxID=31354 RepID=A0A7S1XF71_9RHOD|mmetsp:Transcript_2748/g.5010  ORF Transcript_2748/g.5010 Transcript_2748/m.5010 type:complete len:204 (+) Transcript_2748:48-659(+)
MGAEESVPRVTVGSDVSSGYSDSEAGVSVTVVQSQRASDGMSAIRAAVESIRAMPEVTPWLSREMDFAAGPPDVPVEDLEHAVRSLLDAIHCPDFQSNRPGTAPWVDRHRLMLRKIEVFCDEAQIAATSAQRAAVDINKSSLASRSLNHLNVSIADLHDALERTLDDVQAIVDQLGQDQLPVPSFEEFLRTSPPVLKFARNNS